MKYLIFVKFSQCLPRVGPRIVSALSMTNYRCLRDRRTPPSLGNPFLSSDGPSRPPCAFYAAPPFASVDLRRREMNIDGSRAAACPDCRPAIVVPSKILVGMSTGMLVIGFVGLPSNWRRVDGNNCQ